MKTALLFAPGSSESYSNTGFSILAAIIENVTQDYDRYVQDAILTRSAHANRVHPSRVQVHGLAHGYSVSGMMKASCSPRSTRATDPTGIFVGMAECCRRSRHACVLRSVVWKREADEASTRIRVSIRASHWPRGSDGINFFLYDRFPVMGFES